MTTTSVTSTHSSQGGCPAGSVTAPCCLSRRASHEITGNFARMFKQYGRSTSWFSTRASVTANLPGGVTWENFYYSAGYKYKLSYETNAAAPSGANGTISVSLRAHATVHPIPSTLSAVAPELFTAVTPADITAAFAGWNAAIQTHWTNQNYTVQLGAPDCPGTFPIKFSVSEETNAGNAHITFTVLNLKHLQTLDPANPANYAYPTWAAALTNPADPKHATAQALLQLWRSNAAKFNLGDSRGTLVFAHEYGHWMGWGDEYIEVTREIPHPTNPSGGTVLSEARNGSNVSVRVAARITNPTQVYQSAHGSNQEDIDLTVTAAQHWLMASMGAPLDYPRRYVYTIIDDFIRVYNQDHYGGSSSAYCINVT